MSRTRKIAYGVTAAALTLGVGFGVAGAASAVTAINPSAVVSSDGMPGAHRGPGANDNVEALAELLGVDKADLAAAFKEFRESNKPTTVPVDRSERDRSAFQSALAASLAESLGLDEADVVAALEEAHSAAQAERASALQERLDAAVADGTLTQSEADAVVKAIEAGVLGGGGRH